MADHNIAAAPVRTPCTPSRRRAPGPAGPRRRPAGRHPGRRRPRGSAAFNTAVSWSSVRRSGLSGIDAGVESGAAAVVVGPIADATVTGVGRRQQASLPRACCKCRRMRELNIGMEQPPGLECSGSLHFASAIALRLFFLKCPRIRAGEVGCQLIRGCALPSVCRPASVIRTRVTSIVRGPMTTRLGVAVASPARIRPVKACARRAMSGSRAQRRVGRRMRRGRGLWDGSCRADVARNCR